MQHKKIAYNDFKILAWNRKIFIFNATIANRLMQYVGNYICLYMSNLSLRCTLVKQIFFHMHFRVKLYKHIVSALKWQSQKISSPIYRLWRERLPDLSYLAPDCFHFSQKLHALGRSNLKRQCPEIFQCSYSCRWSLVEWNVLKRPKLVVKSKRNKTMISNL